MFYWHLQTLFRLMKALFYLAVFLMIAFEIANVYFIMPLPGSQQMNSIDLAYFLYSWRWYIRIGLGLLTLFSFWRARFKRVWIPLLALLPWAFVAYQFNYKMTAEQMFIQPKLVMNSSQYNNVSLNRVVLGVTVNGEASAYPIQYLAYHHQVRDVVGGQLVMVTYCNVCRTGRVFDPKVADQSETFRLVGMDHFNAMFEDSRTHSWWRQENGEAIAGPLKGKFLPELPSSQMALKQWLKFHPNSKVMQPDSAYTKEYAHQKNYENGNKKGKLTRTDSLSWKDKSWVVGVKVGQYSKAFDWNELKEKRVLNENVGNTPIAIVLAKDNKSFVAFERPNLEKISMKGDTLYSQVFRYNWYGVALDPGMTNLKKINAYQEFWHSWRTFHGDAR